VIVVVDSGVWISALHFGGIPLAALDQVFLSDELAICDQIVTEIRVVLTSKFQWESSELGDVLDEYLTGALNVVINGTLQGVCRDPKDDMVLECAVNAEAQLVVTGDNDILALGSFRDIRIVTPRTYLAAAQNQNPGFPGTRAT
jgi:putative PIN family toxin of toxin-antitoxin system